VKAATAALAVGLGAGVKDGVGEDDSPAFCGEAIAPGEQAAIDRAMA
jgi:hypothetical protein